MTFATRHRDMEWKENKKQEEMGNGQKEKGRLKSKDQ
jgi:hypothetical protein